MRSIVFATYDITPEEWTDFKTAADQWDGRVDDSPPIPYTLIYSASQNLDESEDISSKVRTEFRSATLEEGWEQIKQAFLDMTMVDKNVFPGKFLILDQQSVEDRKVIIMWKNAELVDAEGNKAYDYRESDVTRLDVWRKYRIPFQECFPVECGMEGFCGLDGVEDHFETIIQREVCVQATNAKEAYDERSDPGESASDKSDQS